MATKKNQGSVTAVPRNRVEAEELLANIGRLQRLVGAVELAMNDELALIKARHEQEAQPLNAQLEADFQALCAYAERHRDELLEGESKTVKLATGVLSWRMSPPSVRLTKPDAVVDTLQRLGLERFVRTKHEVDKQAILAEPEAVAGVKGITITQREEFVAKPFESEIEKAEPAKAVLREVGGGRR